MSCSTSNHPRVFISYSHDSSEHKERVLDFSDRLHDDGIDCSLDQYEESPSEGWPQWRFNQIQSATFVLVVCTENYERRFRGVEDPGKALGVNRKQASYESEYDLKQRVEMIRRLPSVDLEVLYLITRYPEWNPREVAALDEAFREEKTSIRAMERRSRRLKQK